MMPFTLLSLLPFSEAVAILVLLGFLLTRLVFPKDFPPILAWAFAPAVGAGMCAFIEYLFRRPMFTMEFLLLLVLAVIWFLRDGLRIPKLTLPSLRVPAFVVLLAVAIGIALLKLIDLVTRLPHGATDGWAIWNSHARYLYRDGPNWTEHIWNTFHADYPLLVPLMNARIWRYAGEVPDLGGLWAIIFGLSGVGLLAAVLAELRGLTLGVLAAFVLVGTPLYLRSTGMQEGDVPLSVFYLATLTLVLLHFERMPNRYGIIALAGFTAGCAAWTKNEGLLFLLATSAVMLLPVLWKPSATLRRFVVYFAGLLVPLTVILIFKMKSGTPNDLFQDQHFSQIVSRIMTPSRYWMIAKTVLHTARTFGEWSVSPFIPLTAFLLLKGLDWRAMRGSGWVISVAILALVASGYIAIYVITPMDLQWHLDSSLNRLMLHLWPSVLLLAGAAALGNRQTAESD